MADRMSDPNETGPGILRLNGKNYDKKCLDAYPWTKWARCEKHRPVECRNRAAYPAGLRIGAKALSHPR